VKPPCFVETLGPQADSGGPSGPARRSARRVAVCSSDRRRCRRSRPAPWRPGPIRRKPSRPASRAARAACVARIDSRARPGAGVSRMGVHGPWARLRDRGEMMRPTGRVPETTGSRPWRNLRFTPMSRRLEATAGRGWGRPPPSGHPGQLQYAHAGVFQRATASVDGPRMTVVPQRTRCGSMKAQPAARGPEATPERASVSSDRRAQRGSRFVGLGEDLNREGNLFAGSVVHFLRGRPRVPGVSPLRWE
jgi:hypothetical protein